MAEITWIKLKTDMFDDEKIKLIERMPEGDGILIIWVKLLAYAGKVNCGGYIMIAEDIPMNIEEMAIIFNRPLEKVRYAIQVLQRYRMIDVDENERICISNWEKHQNIDGMEKVRLQTAERNRKYRERKKQQALQAPSDVSQNNNSDVSVTSRDGTEKEEEIDKEVDKEKERVRERNNPLPPSPLKDEDYIKIKQHFEQYVIFQQADFQQNKQLGDLVDDYKDPQLIIEAMKTAVERGVPKIPYINGILKGWRTDGITNHQQLAQMGGKSDGATKPSGRSNSFKDTFGHDVGF